MNKSHVNRLAGLLAGLLAGGFPLAVPAADTGPDQALRTHIRASGLSGDPAQGRTLPDIRSPKAQLGMRLFFNKALGGKRDSACVSCHHPLLAGADALPLSIGVDAFDADLLGPGRLPGAGAHQVTRNAPTTFNTALWDAVLFWDGRLESLNKVPGANGTGGAIRTPDVLYGKADARAGADLVSAQARFPVISVDEMRSRRFGAGEHSAIVRQRLVQRLRGEGVDGLAHPGYWLEQFRRVYGGEPGTAPAQLITEERVFDALGAYQRSQVFVDNPWKQYVRGDVDAISSEAKRGALLFFRPYAQGGANCAACHQGDFFTDEQFHTLAMPQIGRGLRGGSGNTHDFGRGYETGRPEDRFSFRTPSLLNVTETAPYSHAGAYPTLAAVVRHHLDPVQALQDFHPDHLPVGVEDELVHHNTARALNKLQRDQAQGRTPLRAVSLTEAQISDLLAFLGTLTDPCLRDAACLAPWIPPAAEDPNGLQVDFGGQND